MEILLAREKGPVTKLRSGFLNDESESFSYVNICHKIYIGHVHAFRLDRELVMVLPGKIVTIDQKEWEYDDKTNIVLIRRTETSRTLEMPRILKEKHPIKIKKNHQ